MNEEQHIIAVVNGTSRLAQQLIPQALTAGYQVRAIVRSSSRFYAAAKKHDDLSAHEIASFHDVSAFRDVLKGVATLYVALAVEKNIPTTLNQDTVQTAVAALQLETNASGRETSPTKVVFLSSHNVASGRPVGFPFTRLLSYQFEDLIRTQTFLAKQAPWLRSIIVSAGGLIDVPDPHPNDFRIQDVREGMPEGMISYRRLAAALLSAGDQSAGRWDGMYIAPCPTSEVKFGLADLTSMGTVVWDNFTRYALPRLLTGTSLLSLGILLGSWYHAPTSM